MSLRAFFFTRSPLALAFGAVPSPPSSCSRPRLTSPSPPVWAHPKPCLVRHSIPGAG